jgi:hypothetical protein
MEVPSYLESIFFRPSELKMKGRDNNKPCWCGSGLKYKKCHRARVNQPSENPWVAIEANRRAFQEKKCWAENVGFRPCGGRIIKAHTISRGPNLKPIAKAGHVLHYTADMRDLIKNGGKLSVQSIGIKEASVFQGFCAEHDALLFSCIENEPFTGRPDQILVNAYRTMSRELYGKDASAGLKTRLNGADKGRPLDEQIGLQLALRLINSGNEASRLDFRATHAALTEALVNQKLSVLKSLVIRLDGHLPFMYSGAWSPFTDLNGANIQIGHADELLEQIFVTSFFAEMGDWICISWLDRPDAAGKIIANQIAEMPMEQISAICLQLVVKHVENIFFNPDWFTSLADNQRNLLDRLAHSGLDFLGSPPTEPIRPDISFALPKAAEISFV